MANTPDSASCLAADDGRSELLPLSPFQALHYHFGMLLGVDDFETEQAYHRAKMRLHNAWLHRAGVVWGFDVRLDQSAGEIRVTPGLALDAAGHELHLQTDACVNVGEWFDLHRDDAGVVIGGDADNPLFDAYVVIRFKACLNRQVPALLEPCDNAATGTAYSRVFETIEILLLPNQAPAPVLPYHRLRLLAGLDQPHTESEDPTTVTESDQAVLDALAQLKTLPSGEQTAAYLNAFHRFAALDEIDLQPASSEDGARLLLFPGQDDEALVLADITGIQLQRSNNGWTLTAGSVDTALRPTHIATATQQDLLAAALAGAGSANTGSTAGPRADAGSITISDSEISLTFDQPLQPASVTAAAFSVSVFDSSSGWQIFTPDDPPALSNDDKTVTLTLSAASLPAQGLVRLIARGSGPTPLLGANLLPRAGATTAAPAAQGADFVSLQART
jgi:hypothetical protein